MRRFITVTLPEKSRIIYGPRLPPACDGDSRMNSRRVGSFLEHGVSKLLSSVDHYTGITNLGVDISDRILEYHSIDGGLWDSISTDRFRQDISYIQDKYTIADLSEVVRNRDEQKTIAITFDDGYKDFYHNALPIIRDTGIQVTVFLIGQSLIDPEFNHDELFDYDYMTEQQLRELAEDKHVQLGNHTVTHPNLTKIEEAANLEYEIIGGKEIIQDRLGVKVDRFCYPYNNYTMDVANIVRETHDIAVCGGGRTNLITSETDPILLPRINASVSHKRLKWELTDMGVSTAAVVGRRLPY